ncbi:MAG: hypothetical protein ACM3S1_11505 [Hyphomicrobiales bacterium]
MTKVLRTLAFGGFAAMLGVVLLGFSGAFSAQQAEAQSPPARPSRFVGSVTIDGAPAPVGTVVEARIGDANCGSTTVFTANGESRYSIDVQAHEPNGPDCGTDGATVVFVVGGRVANETGEWHDYQLGTVNLTVTAPTATATATATQPGGTATTTATQTSTPKPPPSGTGLADSDGTPAWLFVALGLGVLAFGVGGAAVARRSR